MWQKSSQTLETSIDALHSATFVGVGDFPTNATLLVNRRAADVAAEKQNVDLQLALSILNLKSGRAFFVFVRCRDKRQPLEAVLPAIVIVKHVDVLLLSTHVA